MMGLSRKAEVRKRWPAPLAVAAGVLSLLGAARPAAAGTQGAFTAVNNPASFQTQIRVMPGVTAGWAANAATIAGWSWGQANSVNLSYTDVHGKDEWALWSTFQYLRGAIKNMTGKTLTVVDTSDDTSGIVLTTPAAAPADISGYGTQVASNGTDLFNANEAYYVRTESTPARAIIMANSIDGLSHGVVDLLMGDNTNGGQNIGYEVLGMGPDWINVPDYNSTALVFGEDHADRPGFYVRSLWPTWGQQNNVGTINAANTLTDAGPPPDETVEFSYNRWQLGTYMNGQSMPPFGSQIMSSYHKAVCVQLIHDHSGGSGPQSVAGFLCPTLVGTLATRPAPTTANKGTFYIQTDNATAPVVALNVTGSAWSALDTVMSGVFLDLSTPVVQGVMLNGVHVTGFDQQGMKDMLQGQFTIHPDTVVNFNTEGEDTGVTDATFIANCYNKDWWPQYRTANSMTLGAYVLNNFYAAGQPNQPTETWWNTLMPTDPTDATNNAQSDSVFAFANYLLHEYDKYIDTLPAGNDVVTGGVVTTVRQNTSTGKSKKTLALVSLYSANYHDVPPLFNLDGRVRVQPQAGYAKHRGGGMWQMCKTDLDAGRAFHALAPSSWSGVYTILSSAEYHDLTTTNIVGGQGPANVFGLVNLYYTNNYRSYSSETDFNFGKFGLEYYMYAKMLWKPSTSQSALTALRTRWLQRSFGPGATAMDSYYTMMQPENWFNAPSSWSKAMSYIDQAQTAINSPTSVYQQRLDDVKQYWYYYYLTSKYPAYPATDAHWKEFVWRGQMSYMTAMQMVTRKWFGNYDPYPDAGTTYTGPKTAELRAHYLHSETDAWWALVEGYWPPSNPLLFANVTLNDGSLGSTVDQDDLVKVSQFQSTAFGNPYTLNVPPLVVSVKTVALTAGATVGFKMYWKDPSQTSAPVNYGVSYYDQTLHTWQTLSDIATTTQNSVAVSLGPGHALAEVAEVDYPAVLAGTYRFDIVTSGYNAPSIVSLDYNLATTTYPTHNQLFSYFQPMVGNNWPANMFYIPKGVTSMDFEVPTSGASLNYQLNLFNGLPSTGLTATRTLAFTGVGLHQYTLNAGEAGSFGQIYCPSGGSAGAFSFPFLYSVPNLYGPGGASVAVPRKVAQADGLTILGP